MPWWVERDTGIIVAMFARKQPGTAEESVTPLSYSISADMPGGAVEVVTLAEEIRASAIETNLFCIWVEGNDLNFIFDTLPLPAGDQTILDNDTTGPAGGLLAAHDNGARPEIKFLAVPNDPTVTAVDAPKASIISYGAKLYRKLDDGATTNVEPIGSARIKTGTYTGDGTTSQPITGIGFSPIYLRIWERDATPASGIVITETTPEIMDDDPTGGAVLISSGSVIFDDDRAISLDDDGFTVDDVGTNKHPNTLDAIYNYLAIG